MRLRTILPALLVALVAAPAGAQTVEIRPVDFLLRGVVDAAAGGSIERARIIVTRTDDGSVLVDRVFTDATGNYLTVFQADTEVALGLGDPPDDGFEPGPRRAQNWMGAAWPNPIRGDGNLRLTLPYSALDQSSGAPELEIFDPRGRRMNPRKPIVSGVYFYRLRFGERRSPARKLMVLGRGKLSIDLLALDSIAAVATAQARPETLAKGGEGTLEVEVRVEKAGLLTQQQIIVLDSRQENIASFSLGAEAPPTAVASIGGTLQVGAAVLFDGSTSTEAGGGALDHAWEFGDGQRGGGETVAHVYAMPGEYTLTLTVAAPFGTTANTTSTITIVAGAPPVSSNAMLVGSITDAVGNRLEGVVVTHVESAATATSLADGSVTLTNMPTGVPLVLELTKDNYTLQTVRLVLPGNNQFTTFQASLRQRRAAVALTRVEDGGLSESEDGACVILPPDALMRTDGSLASGEATVRITPVDVSDRVEIAAFPGGFEGVRPTGQRGLLSSYGVMEVVFEQAGAELQLAPGRWAEVEIPVYAASAVMGQSIDLWSVDSTTGLWRQEGSGIVVASEGSPTGMALRAEVTHFSWWNIDKFDDDPRPGRPRCKTRDVDGLPVLDIPEGESCYICSETLEPNGPFAGPKGPIPPEGQDELFPGNVDVLLTGTSANGSLRGSTLFGLGPAKMQDIIIVLEPIAAGGGKVDLPVSLEAAIDPAGEVDVYGFDGHTDQYVSLFARAGQGSFLGGTLTLVDPNGTTLLSGAFSTTAFSTVYKLPEPGEYTVEIDGTINEPGAYDIDLRFVESFDVQLSSKVVANLQPGLMHNFQLDVPVGEWFTLNFRRLSGTGSGATLRIESPAGELVLERFMSSTRFSTKPIQLASAGTHNMTITSNTLDWEYELVVRDIPEILPGAIVESAGEDGTWHYYRFEASAGDMLHGSLDAMDSYNGQVAIVDRDGNILPAALPPVIFGNSSSIYQLENSGTHFLLVWASSTNDPLLRRPYRAGLNVLPQPRALSFGPAGRATHTPDIARFGDIKVFQFDANEGDGLNIEMRASPGSSVTKAALFRLYRVGIGTPRDPAVPINPFSSTNARFSGDDVSGILQAEYFRLPADDTYILLLTSPPPEDGSFELTVDLAASGANLVVDDDLAQNPGADTRSLAAAMMATTAGGTIQLEAGDYIAAATFWPAETITLEGADRDGTVLGSASHATVLRSDIGFNAIRDLTLHAQFGSSHQPLSISNAQSMVIERVATRLDPGLDPTFTAIQITSSNDVTVRDCLFRDTNNALKFNVCDNVIVENNIFANATGKIDATRSSGLQIMNNQWTQDQIGTAIRSFDCVGTIIAGNDIDIATGEIGSGALEFAIEVRDRDDAGDQPATVLRDNRIVTNEAGISATVYNAGSSIVIERNLITQAQDLNRTGIVVESILNEAGQTVVIRNNVLDGTTSFGAINVRDAERYESVEIINNTLRTSQAIQAGTGEWAVGISTDVAVFSGPLPVLIVNNVFVGNGGLGISIPLNTTIDSDYNLFFGFSANYDRGSTSTGTNDLEADPQFVDAELRVSAGSPAVDSGAGAGEISAVPADDVFGGVRPVGGGVDRGGHER